MGVETHVDRARDRVRTEVDALDAKSAAFETFLARVKRLPPEPTPRSSAVAATGGTDARLRADGATDEGCRAVRTAFDETVRSHSVADVETPEPLLETVRSEFTDSIALALAPTTDTSFSAGVKRAVVAETETRRRETAALRRALDREAESLAAAAAAVDEVTTWVVEADERPLTDCGFDALRRRHATLAAHRERCERVAADRQVHLDGTTAAAELDTAVTHRALPPYLYDDFPTDYPVLSTVARLDDTCADCQRAVRGHLVRRA
ncbi:DUF7260 family protein [Candidatus Halobonum tyrrellensis]|uniref:DUF7260 family protein n=1 Tax=Candidatus Halobonum tyrrellensis TaxID=1431545 RepID=UPI0006776621|nr:hypothetical protein [Candidatus Halobonum tyrrellensis]